MFCGQSRRALPKIEPSACQRSVSQNAPTTIDGKRVPLPDRKVGGVIKERDEREGNDEKEDPMNPDFPDGLDPKLTLTSDSCMGLKGFVAAAGVESDERDG